MKIERKILKRKKLFYKIQKVSILNTTLQMSIKWPIIKLVSIKLREEAVDVVFAVGEVELVLTEKKNMLKM